MKKRLDVLLVERGLFESLALAQAAVMEGRVLVDEVKVEKAGHMFLENCEIRILGDDPEYVSRGGLKLEAAIEHFKIDVSEKTCLDVGASTGGFTDCLLQNGARKVVAVDVGKGQLHNKLMQDERVEVCDGVNARYLDRHEFDPEFDIITIDVSFISQRLVIPAIKGHLKSNGIIVALIKPQFEAEKENVGEGGIVRDESVRKEVVDRLVEFYNVNGFDVIGTIESPITGAEGNVEFLIAASKK
ncbi:TlyA family RNA methyltransferase [bacterium]|nr:TlyA family RNA methyltransferase [bacterium]MBU1025002.1 TlyA family RNA methyltransferase [bacterium]